MASDEDIKADSLLSIPEQLTGVPTCKGQGDLVSRLLTTLSHMIALVFPIIILLSPPDPPSIRGFLRRTPHLVIVV